MDSAYGFLFMIKDDHASILHGDRNTRPQRYWGPEFDLLESRDVISHLTVGSADRECPVP